MTQRVIDKLGDIADQLREQAWEAEKLGQLPDETVKLMKAAGNIKLLQPKEYDGLEVHPREFAETVMATAALDPAAGRRPPRFPIRGTDHRADAGRRPGRRRRRR